MKSATDIDRRDLSEMTAYHEARIEALQRTVKEQERTIDEQAKELERLREGA